MRGPRPFFDRGPDWVHRVGSPPIVGCPLETNKLVTIARECGFRKLLSALDKDLQKARAEMPEIIATAAADELAEPDCRRLKETIR